MTLSDREALFDAVRGMHESIRAAVGELLERARTADERDLTARPGAWGAGDVSYALDDAADQALGAFLREVGARREVTLVAEGPGLSQAAPAEPSPLQAVRVLVDPVDGTRSLMHDMRSAWVLTGVAPDHGSATRLSHVELAVQTELPTTTAAVYHVLHARRGEGAVLERRSVATGELLDRRELRVRPDLALDNGYLAFARYLAVERPLVAELERCFLERALAAHGLDPRLIYDDQYLCSAGQLYLVTTGRYRLLADLRGWLREVHGLANFTAKPYDLAALLVYQEAGVDVLDAQGRPLDAPLDTETPLSVVAYGNARLRAAFEPHLRAALDEVTPPRAE